MTQSAIGCHDLPAQIQRFWNISSNLNFKENSFNPFPSFSGKIGSEYLEIKYFFATNHGGVRD